MPKIRASICTWLALALPLPILLVGAGVAVSQPFRESDWLGLGRVFVFAIALVVASLVTLTASSLAFVRSEPRAALSLLGAAPSALLVGGVAVFVATGLHGDFLRGQHADLVERLVADPGLRQELVSRAGVDDAATRALLSIHVRDLLTPAQVVQVWEARRAVDTGQSFQRLIGPAHTPASVLRDYYERVMALDHRVHGERSYRSLVHHNALLSHRNLPQDILDEILAGADADVIAQLRSNNPRLTSNPAILERW